MERRNFVFSIQALLFSVLGIKPKQEELCLRSGKDKYYFRNEELYLIESGIGDKNWYKNGLRHREDGPAIEYANGTKYWYKNGLLHREDGPAIEYKNGTKFWYLNGKPHRDNGPACEYADGDKQWFKNGFLKHIEKPNKF